MHDGRFEPGQQRGGAVGVDRVVVTGDHREGTHVGRCRDGDVTTATTRRLGRVVGDRATGTRRVAQFGPTCTAPDGEPFLQLRQHIAVGIGDVDGDRHDTPVLGVKRR